MRRRGPGAAQVAADSCAGPVESRHDGPGWNLQDPGNFLIGQILEMAQEHHLALVGRQAARFTLTDAPSARKIHTRKLPRAGGIALFSGFFFPFLLLLPLQQYSLAARNLFADERIAYFAAGAGIIFFLGLLDDIRGLSPLLKLAGQVLAALLVYFCGFRIAAVTMPFFGADFSPPAATPT